MSLKIYIPSKHFFSFIFSNFESILICFPYIHVTKDKCPILNYGF